MKLYTVSIDDASGRVGGDGLFLKFKNALNRFDELVAYAGGRAREVSIGENGESRSWSSGRIDIRLSITRTED